MHYPGGVRLFSFVVAVGLSGCVTGVERRATNSEAARETPPPPADEPHAGQLTSGAPKARPDPTPEAPLGSNWVWVRGYWHWDGVRHVWVRGRWEPARPSYLRPLPR